MDDKTYQSQIKKVTEAFKEHPKTMLQVSVETDILRGNICYFVRDLRKQKKIVTVKKGKCPVSKHKAQFLSTDPEYFPKETQPELFPPERYAV